MKGHYRYTWKGSLLSDDRAKARRDDKNCIIQCHRAKKASFYRVDLKGDMRHYNNDIKEQQR